MIFINFMPGSMGNFLVKQIYHHYPHVWPKRVAEMRRRKMFMQSHHSNHEVESDRFLARHDMVLPEDLAWLIENVGTPRLILTHDIGLLPRWVRENSSVIDVRCNKPQTQHTAAFLSWMKNAPWHVKYIIENEDVYQGCLEELHRYTNMYLPYADANVAVDFDAMSNADVLRPVLRVVAEEYKVEPISTIDTEYYREAYENSIKPINTYDKLYKNFLRVYEVLSQYKGKSCPDYQDAFLDNMDMYKDTVETVLTLVKANQR